MALPMTVAGGVTKPLVWVLDTTSRLIFKLLRLDRETEEHVTAEELHLIVAEASQIGRDRGA